MSLHLSLDEGTGPRPADQHVGTAYPYVEDADALYDEWSRARRRRADPPRRRHAVQAS